MFAGDADRVFKYWSLNERVLVGHLRGMCKNVGQAEQLCGSCGGWDLKKKKIKFFPFLHAVE